VSLRAAEGLAAEGDLAEDDREADMNAERRTLNAEQPYK